MPPKNDDYTGIEEIDEMFKKKPDQSFSKTAGTVYEYYLNGEITDASKYTEWFNAIRHAGREDLIKIYINSCGGDMFTAIQFIRCMRESGARVMVSVEGACMSAATIIFLMADDFEVTPHSMFMFHNYSSASFGKGGEMMDQIRHETAWAEKLLKDIYRDFLTSAEIEQILANKDVWMDAEEVIRRLNARKKILEKKAKLAEKSVVKKAKVPESE